jgi:hypothetical protein
MTHPRVAARLATGLVAAASLALAFGTGTASAAPPALPTPTAGTATAQSLSTLLLGASAVTTPTATATPGNSPSSAAGGPALLDTVSVQALSAQASSDSTGTAACAGISGPGGAISIGSNGACTITGVTGPGITLGPAILGGNTLTFQAIVESCSYPAGGTPTATLQILGGTFTPVGGTPVTLTSNQLAPNQTLANAGALATITLNNQTTTSTGISARGLTAAVLAIPGGTDVLDALVGTVTCGTPAAAAGTSVFPLASLPIAGGTALVLAAIVVPWYRRRSRRSGTIQA